MKVMGRYTALLLALSVLLGLNAAPARADMLYQIEMIVFARDTLEAESEEHWPSDTVLHYPDHLNVLQAADGGSAPFQLLPTTTLQLNREASVLSQRHLRVLFHGAWQQTLDENGRTGSVFIGGGQTFADHQELEGYVTFSVEKFLKIDTNLWLSHFVRAADANAATAQSLPASPLSRDSANTGPAAYTASEVYVLQEQRRMRSGELHYQDHPRLGVLVMVVPVGGSAARPGPG
jgi:hypothetical protein